MVRAVRSAARALTGVAGAQLGLILAGRARRWVGPVLVSARAQLGPGGLRVDLPPAGSATVRTHRGPLAVAVSVSDVDPSRAEGLLRMPADDSDAEDIESQLRRVLAGAADDARALGRALAGRSALAGVCGATALGALTLHRPRDAAGAAAAGAALLAGMGALAAATIDREAWRDPQLHGLLAQAPVLIGDLRTAPDRIDTYRYQLADLVRTGTGVYRRVATLPEPPPQDAIRLLHLSDVHLSPAAFPLAAALIDVYGLDAVIDTGDLVDWGTPAEEAFAGQIAGLGVPYVFVKGNHDSPGIAAAVGRQPNATVLELTDAPVDVVGLRFAGMADPRFTPNKTTGDDFAEHRVSERAVRFAQQLAGKNVDVALVHDPAAARALAGTVPLVLAGHTHKRAARRYGDTTVLVQGSSGGSGLRGVQADPPTSIALSVVYVERARKRLWGVDEVTLGGLGSVTLSVVRRTAAELVSESESG
ncbi:MAG TPA: metallophosphoesterase [Jatrophihabitans sp.]|nr:metallophosphoesterase [Jatrophihabitans sp.]